MEYRLKTYIILFSAVWHLQRGSGNDAGMSCHIERKTADGKVYIPDNADKTKTHLNQELISYPKGVRNRTDAVQYRIDHAGLHRKFVPIIMGERKRKPREGEKKYRTRNGTHLSAVRSGASRGTD